MKTQILISIFAMFFIALQAFANVVGTDTQNFNTTTDGLDFVTVESSKTLSPGIINFGLFLNYAVNTLPYFEANPGSRSSYNDSLLGSDVNFGIGLMNNWDAGISFPDVLSQYVQNTTLAGGQFSNYGNTEIRPNTKVRFLGNDNSGLALVASVNFNRITNNPYSGMGGGPTYNLELVGDKKLGDFDVALNVGHRWRQPGAQIPGIPIQPFGNQIIYSGGANYLIPHTDTKAIFEIFGANATDTSNTDQTRTQASLEALVGIKHDFTTSLAFHAGFGTEIAHAIASPDWRVYTGINYTMGPLWHKTEQPLERVEERIETPPRQEKFIAHNILFEFNSDVLTGDYEKTLTELVNYLHKPSGSTAVPAEPREFTKLTIEGHTDSVGSETYNMNLSQRRANAIKKYLVEHFNISDAKIESIGFGPTQPIADNGNYQGRQQNRRVEFKVDR